MAFISADVLEVIGDLDAKYGVTCFCFLFLWLLASILRLARLVWRYGIRNSFKQRNIWVGISVVGCIIGIICQVALWFLVFGGNGKGAMLGRQVLFGIPLIILLTGMVSDLLTNSRYTNWKAISIVVILTLAMLVEANSGTKKSLYLVCCAVFIHVVHYFLGGSGEVREPDSPPGDLACGATVLSCLLGVIRLLLFFFLRMKSDEKYKIAS
jgi:hypothetical protein